MAVINGNADVTINDDSTLRFYLNTVGANQLKIVGDLLTGDSYGIAVPKGNAEVLETINAGLKTLVENGTYDALYEKWLGVEPTRRPGN